MKDALSFLSENWGLVVLVATVSLSLINGMMRHYKELQKARWLHVLIDALSFVTRSDSPGSLKLPGRPSKPPMKTFPLQQPNDAGLCETRLAVTLLACLVAVMLFLQGCGSWQSTSAKTLITVKETAMATHAAVRPVLRSKCLAAAKKCTVPADQCAPLQRCYANRRLFDDAVEKVLDGIRVAAIAVLAAISADDEKSAGAAVTVVLAHLSDLTVLARKYGVLP